MVRVADTYATTLPGAKATLRYVYPRQDQDGQIKVFCCRYGFGVCDCIIYTGRIFNAHDDMMYSDKQRSNHEHIQLYTHTQSMQFCRHLHIQWELRTLYSRLICAKQRRGNIRTRPMYMYMHNKCACAICEQVINVHIAYVDAEGVENLYRSMVSPQCPGA